MALDIGSRIIELRGERGLSQEGLANQLGLSRQAVSRWERGEALPDTENLIALADLFGVTLDELVRPGRKDGDGQTGAQAPSPEDAPEAEPAPDDEDAGEEGVPEDEDEDEDEEDEDADVCAEDTGGMTVDAEEREGDGDAGEADDALDEASDSATEEVGTEEPADVAAEEEPAAEPGPGAAVPPPRPLWQKALLLVAALASIAISLLFLSRVASIALDFLVPTTHANKDTIYVDGTQVSDIDVMWSGSEVIVYPVEDEQTGGDVVIEVTREDSSPAAGGFDWDLTDGRLRITCNPEDESEWMSVHVMVPMSVALNNLGEIALEGSDNAAGSLIRMKCDKIYVYESGSNVTVEGCETKDLEVRATSGAVWLEGTYENVTLDLSGGAEVSYDAIAAGLPRKMDARVTEANLSISVPYDDCGFTIVERGDAFSIDTNLDLVHREQGMVYGTGEAMMGIEVDDGSVGIMGVR